jgi:RecG-like helicase
MFLDPIFSKYLSKSQIQNLNLAGIGSLYELLIFLPYGLENLEPIENYFGQNYITSFGETDSIESKTKYLFQAKLITFTKNQGKTGQAYFYLTFQSSNRTVNCYYFASSPYAAKNLIVGNEFQMVLTSSNNLWSIEKIVDFKTNVTATTVSPQKTDAPFKLGQAQIKKYILPKYSKTGFLTSPFFAQVFNQIPREFFVLDLQGLVPQNPIVATKINFWDIHHPESLAKYYQVSQQWIGLKVFLKLALMQYIEKNKLKKFTKATQLDINFLKNISGNLPFELSISQKNAIWSILSEVKSN